jgi:glycosyltransferase involved in cell wall biosynthesis
MTGFAGASHIREDFDVSVLLPCHNALPWLCDAVGCILAQRDVRVELIAVDDRSNDGSREWLEACARAVSTAPERDVHDATTAYDNCVDDAVHGRVPWQASQCPLQSPEEVACRAQSGNVLRVLAVRPDGCSGQGLALNEALAVARGRFIAEMEADDLRPPTTLHTLVSALERHADWDGVTSRVVLAGADARGMQRWISWQNGVGLNSPAHMACNRFIEIPAMRAAGLYRREALAALGTRPYRDMWQVNGTGVVDLARGSADGPLPGWWPVDSDFFGRWFSAGLQLAKVDQALYVWRQYPAQSTRTHSRCALERLRACKAFYLSIGPLAGGVPVQLWGCGVTLNAWREELASRGVQVHAVPWRPGQTAEAPPLAAHGVRLWAFGMPKARLRVRSSAPGGFQEGTRDWFIG